MLEPVSQSLKFIFQTLIESYILLVRLRIIFHWVSVSPTNPILLMIGRVTSPCLRPIYSLFPIINGMDLAAIILLSTLSMSKIGMLFFWQTGHIPPFAGLAVLAFAEILEQFVDIFFFIITIFSIMSWFYQSTSTAVIEIVLKIGGPLLHLAQGILPTISGIDFSPLLVLIGLQLLVTLIITPLHQTGTMLIQTAMAGHL